MAKTKRRKPGRKQEETQSEKKSEITLDLAQMKNPKSLFKDSLIQKDLEEEFITTISIHLEPNLFMMIEQMLESRQIAGDYSWSSVADFIREAILDYAQGINLEAQAIGKRTKRFSLRAGKTVVNYWESFPKRKKAEILDRILRTKLNKL